MYTNIMFDLDGTVTDSGRAILGSVEYTLSRLGITNQPIEKLKTFIGPSLFDSFKREYNMSDDDCEKAVSIYRDIYEKEKMYDVDIYEGIPELLANLKMNSLSVFLVTSKPLVFTEKILDRIGLSKYFDYMIGPDLSDHSSDKCRLIERAINDYSLNKHECIMIGDTHYDIKGATDAGIDSIGVTYGYGNPDAMKEAGVTYMVDSVKEIGNILLREGGIPFKITTDTPNQETVSAMLEAERIAKDPSVKGYRDVDKFFEDLSE